MHCWSGGHRHTYYMPAHGRVPGDGHGSPYDMKMHPSDAAGGLGDRQSPRCVG